MEEKTFFFGGDDGEIMTNWVIVTITMKVVSKK